MTFPTLETSRQQGAPAQLYLFVYGGSLADSPPTTQYFAYTDAEQDETFNSITYTPLPIARSAVASSGTLDKSALTVTMSRSAGLATLFQAYPPTQPITLQIRQGHIGDGDYRLIWSGRVLSVGRDGDECVVSAEPLSTALKRPWLRRHYTIGCPFALYQDQCQASKAAATLSSTVSAINGLTVTLASGWNGAYDGSKFVQGLVEWPNAGAAIESRRILSVTGNDLLLAGYLRDLAVSATVDVILGCNHQRDDCTTLHSNINNYGGFDWIPLKNPVGLRNEYY